MSAGDYIASKRIQRTIINVPYTSGALTTEKQRMVIQDAETNCGEVTNIPIDYFGIPTRYLDPEECFRQVDFSPPALSSRALTYKTPVYIKLQPPVQNKKWCLFCLEKAG